MDKFDFFKGSKCLYTPSGAAREYAAVGCNFYRGCPFQCRYCYNRKGITSGIMGVDHAVLESCFVSRPKKYQSMSAENYAFKVFTNDAQQHLDYLRDMGMFLSFSTDPLCDDAAMLTMSTIKFCVEFGIPVKVLTKRALDDFPEKFFPDNYGARNPLECLKFISAVRPNHLVSIGYTLTGRDDEEPNASPNVKRIESMKRLHDMGFKTFASIEPIVDFDSSYKMIKETVGFCDQYLIGLMSKRGKDYPPYEKDECVRFIKKVMNLIKMNGNKSKVYWKHSIRNFIKGSRAAQNAMWDEEVFVEVDYCLQRGTVTYPVHTLSHSLDDALSHLNALVMEQSEKQRRQHETALISFYVTYEKTNNLVDYCEYLSHRDIDALEGMMKIIHEKSKAFMDACISLLENNADRNVFLVKYGKAIFSAFILKIFAYFLEDLSAAILSDIENYRNTKTETL